MAWRELKLNRASRTFRLPHQPKQLPALFFGNSTGVAKTTYTNKRNMEAM